jgi:(4S)-4-hydroxy-5-phosphonooxypentane-2,3-dione isomerase
MFTTLVHVQVKPGFVREFIEATRENHKQSIKEPGNLRFDVLQNASDETRFVLYEAYATSEAVTAHKETSHYLKWRETVEPWMAGPREGVKHTMLFPEAP